VARPYFLPNLPLQQSRRPAARTGRPAGSGSLSDVEYKSQHQWVYGGNVYEVNNFHHSEHDAWCYELYQTGQGPDRNDYIEIRIPDLTPDGQFTPAAVTEAVFLAHGEPRIPLPLLLRLLDLARDYGDLEGTGLVETRDQEK
jgi:hypothetical protein